MPHTLMLPLRGRALVFCATLLLSVVIAPLLRPSMLLAENISLVKEGGVYHVPVEINGVITLHFVLDTGAADVNIPADVVRTLYRAGTIRDADFLPGRTYTLADGSTLNSARFLLRSLKVGSRRIPNVPASIGEISSTLLLGQSFLERLGPWGLDSQRHVLTLGTPRKQKQPTLAQPLESVSSGPQVAVGVYPQPPTVSKTLRNSIGMEFVLLQAGMFQMGSNDGDNDEKPVHTVRLSRFFYLGQYEVTQAQWEAVMGKNPSRFKGDPARPVESVSWDDIQEFIRRLNAREGDASYRLPTEAEWEYAARAGSTTAYSFGDGVSQLRQYAWYGDNAGSTTHPVGRLQPNAWGLYDMYGNVWEWVQDWKGEYPSGTVRDPTGPPSGSARVFRGGGARYCRSASRFYDAPADRRGGLGFRLLREVP